jgi:type I restriction enzyme R subunit
VGSIHNIKTTEQVFGAKLHSCTIVDAINDKNVLPFRIDYVNTLKMKDDIKDKKVSTIDIKRAESAPNRITKVVKYICEHFDQKTNEINFTS